MTSASNGNLTTQSCGQVLAFFARYFARARYLEWSDAAPPAISVSPDGTRGWLTVAIRARYVESAKTEAGKRRFRSSWIATYRRIGCKWQMTGIASAVMNE